MQKAGHIPLSLKNPSINTLEHIKSCNKMKYNSYLQNSNKRYQINPLAMSYNEYSNKYWAEVKYRQAIYRLHRRLSRQPDDCLSDSGQ